MGIRDKSVIQAIKLALNGDKKLSYSDVQYVIRSTFDNGLITVQERDDLKTVLKKSKTIDDRSRVALDTFIRHIGKASKSADAKAARTGNKNIGIRVPTMDTGPFSRRNTDLGKFSHGNFDVSYHPYLGYLFVMLKVKYQFESGINSAKRSALKYRLKQAIKTWDNAGIYLLSMDLVLNPIIFLRFGSLEGSSGQHFTVDAEKADRREWVGMDLNIDQNTSKSTLVHELGHMYGNYDEYEGSGFAGWFERRMYWHDNRYLKDKGSLMNQAYDANAFRPRYFDHFERYVNRKFAHVGATYKVQIKV